MTEVILALGSNLGDRAGNLQRAIDLLADANVLATRTSSTWETPPMPPGQPVFLNAVVAAETTLAPVDLLAAAKAVERALGRRTGVHWGPRPVDIDILFYGETRLDELTLTIPHAGISERAFVLVPLSEVVRGSLPLIGQSALTLLAQQDTTGIHRTRSALRLPSG